MLCDLVLDVQTPVDYNFLPLTPLDLELPSQPHVLQQSHPHSPQHLPRSILTKSHSAGRLLNPPPKRNVSFQLPDDPPSGGTLTLLMQLLRRVVHVTSSSRPTKAEKTPRRILRQPVLHGYLKGVSGLPTQRVPLSCLDTLRCNRHCCGHSVPR